MASSSSSLVKGKLFVVHIVTISEGQWTINKYKSSSSHGFSTKFNYIFLVLPVLLHLLLYNKTRLQYDVFYKNRLSIISKTNGPLRIPNSSRVNRVHFDVCIQSTPGLCGDQLNNL